jgi:hypothetical protein
MTTTTEKRLQHKVDKAMDWDVFRKGIPKLHVVSNLYGEDQDGLAIELDKKHKVAVHEFADGKMVTVPAMRSPQYQELAHDYVFDEIHQMLEDAGLKHKVFKHRYGRNSGELHADIVLEKSYKMDEKAFETEFDVKYTDDDGSAKGEYRPIITVRNSFLRSSMIRMGYLRVVCSNGLIDIAKDSKISKPLYFQHIGHAKEAFSQGINRLITALFDNHAIENLMLNLEAEPVEYEALINWMVQYLGRQATGQIVDQFHLADKALEDVTNMWVAYNMITWATSNVIESVNRAEKAMRAVAQLRS